VPAHLTRAALRIAWATDPAIRDFVGIAENQWDFNDPAAMPGFGPLRAGDDAATLAAQMLGGASNRIGDIAEASFSPPPATPEAEIARRVGPVDKHKAPAPSAKRPADTEIGGLTGTPSEQNVAGEHDRGLDESDGRRNHRSHGRALPQ
jgi:hypothetical protein